MHVNKKSPYVVLVSVQCYLTTDCDIELITSTVINVLNGGDFLLTCTVCDWLFKYFMSALPKILYYRNSEVKYLSTSLGV